MQLIHVSAIFFGVLKGRLKPKVVDSWIFCLPWEAEGREAGGSFHSFFTRAEESSNFRMPYQRTRSFFCETILSGMYCGSGSCLGRKDFPMHPAGFSMNVVSFSLAPRYIYIYITQDHICPMFCFFSFLGRSWFDRRLFFFWGGGRVFPGPSFLGLQVSLAVLWLSIASSLPQPLRAPECRGVLSYPKILEVLNAYGWIFPGSAPPPALIRKGSWKLRKRGSDRKGSHHLCRRQGPVTVTRMDKSKPFRVI